MLSNKDFSNLLKSSGSNGSDSINYSNSKNGDERQRYDLKQISNWEKQNKTDQEKKEKKLSKKNYGEKSSSSNWDKPPADTSRDSRSQPADISKESQELMAKLDEDQTKFLGGDEEHTHLVKGLDFALLAKVKEDLKRLQKGFVNGSDEDEDGEDENNEDLEEEKDLTDINPNTKFGMRLKAVLLKNREMEAQWNENLTHKSQTDSLPAPASQEAGKLSTSSLLDQLDKTGRAYIIDPTKLLAQQQSKQFQQQQKTDSIFQRSVYEFNINPQSTDKNLPLTIVKSKRSSKISEEAVHCPIDPILFSKFLSIYDNGRIIPKNKRLTKEPPSSSASSSAAVPSAAMALPSLPPSAAAAPASASKTNPIPKGFDSIYDDLDDVKYDPAIVPMEGITSSQTSKKTKRRRPVPVDVAVIFSDGDEDYEDEDAMDQKLTTPSTSLKGLFRNITHTAVQIPRETTMTTASVRNLMPPPPPPVPGKSQREKELEELKQRYGDSTAPTMATGKKKKGADEAEKKIIHRDVFASTLDNIVYADANFGKKEGDTFGLKGEYDDIFPESVAPMEGFGNDDDEEGDGKDAKKGKSRGPGDDDDDEDSRPKKKKTKFAPSSDDHQGSSKRGGDSAAGSGFSRGGFSSWKETMATSKGSMTPAIRYNKK